MDKLFDSDPHDIISKSTFFNKKPTLSYFIQRCMYIETVTDADISMSGTEYVHVHCMS